MKIPIFFRFFCITLLAICSVSVIFGQTTNQITQLNILPFASTNDIKQLDNNGKAAIINVSNATKRTLLFTFKYTTWI